ncbi:MAG: acetate kinase [Oscillospiraceae bacterium]|nr:acetate kinase [Oscillospiraceae bacterium]
MKVLVINAGSSSLKYQLIQMEDESVLAKGICERIGMENGIFSYKSHTGFKLEKTVEMKNHEAAFHLVAEALEDPEHGVVNSLSEISAIGHRVVQGADLFMESCLVTDEVLEGIRKCARLAPLHNLAHIEGITACQKVFGKEIPEVVVFDTGFHATMPKKAYMYAIPYAYYEKYSIRRYGFHGTSHRYVSEQCIHMLGDPEHSKIITCHLGNGSSITAVKDGKCIDTTMGLTPLDGFMMGTRSGSLDPSIVTFLQQEENLSAKEMDTVLNKKSGLLGISGISSDDRDVTKAEEEGNERAILAHEMLQYQIEKYIGGFIVALGGCDAIVFTAGIGENHVGHREKICEALSFLGVDLDKEKNQQMVGGKGGEITKPGSKIKVFVIPTNEELMIARETKALCEA